MSRLPTTRVKDEAHRKSDTPTEVNQMSIKKLRLLLFVVLSCGCWAIAQSSPSGGSAPAGGSGTTAQSPNPGAATPPAGTVTPPAGTTAPAGSTTTSPARTTLQNDHAS